MQEQIASIPFEKWLPYIETYAIRLAGAIATLVIGFWLIKRLQLLINCRLDKASIDPAVKSFSRSVIGIVLKIALVLTIINILGIQATSFVAILGAAGLAIGMALSGTLQNFAGGVVILVLRPYRIGDFIEAKGHTGKVNAIHIFHTILTTPDNKTVILPNGPVSTGAIVNYTTQGQRRREWVFGIGYNSNLEEAKSIIESLIKQDNRILTTPEPLIAVGELADSSVNLVVRAWVENDDFAAVGFDLNEKVKLAFDQKGIEIPYPQRVVHMMSE